LVDQEVNLPMLNQPHFPNRNYADHYPNKKEALNLFGLPNFLLVNQLSR